MNDRPAPTPWNLAVAFVNVGLTSIGGAAGPLRHVIVKQRRWLTEGEFAEMFGMGQALPGANAINVAVLLGDRSSGPLGMLAAVAGLCLPSLVLALLIATAATHVAATNPRFAAAEVTVTAAVAGIFMANGLRLVTILWRDAEPDAGTAVRAGRTAVSALGIVLVAGLHLWIPVAVVILVGTSLALESIVRRRARPAA